MKHGRGYVYDLYFHIVWCVKNRQNQGGEHAKRLKDKIVS